MLAITVGARNSMPITLLMLTPRILGMINAQVNNKTLEKYIVKFLIPCCLYYLYISLNHVPTFGADILIEFIFEYVINYFI